MAIDKITKESIHYTKSVSPIIKVQMVDMLSFRQSNSNNSSHKKQSPQKEFVLEADKPKLSVQPSNNFSSEVQGAQALFYRVLLGLPTKVPEQSIDLKK